MAQRLYERLNAAGEGAGVERVFGDQPHAVVVLNEALADRDQVAGVRATGDLERRQLHDGRVELRQVRHHPGGLGLDHRAGQPQVEELAGAHRAGGGAPPAMGGGGGGMPPAMGGGGAPTGPVQKPVAAKILAKDVWELIEKKYGDKKSEK